jgi:hypothetical protein
MRRGVEGGHARTQIEHAMPHRRGFVTSAEPVQWPTDNQRSERSMKSCAARSRSCSVWTLHRMANSWAEAFDGGVRGPIVVFGGAVTRRHVSMWAVAGAWSLLLLASNAYAQAPLLLVAEPRSTTDALDVDVISQQEVTVTNVAALSDPTQSAIVQLDLAAGLSLRAARATSTTGDISWFGTVENAPDSSVVLRVDANGIVTGRMFGPFGAFRVRQKNGHYLAEELWLDSSVNGTQTNHFPIIPFLEGTDVFWTLQKANDHETRFPYKLEADMFPHLVVAQNFTDILDISKQQRKGLEGLKEFSYSISGTPAVRIRMSRATSAPVRTPSYMPRGNFQFLWVRGLKDCAGTESGSRKCQKRSSRSSAGLMATSGVLRALASLPAVSIWESHFMIGHHSNGQDGCLSIDQHRDPPVTGPCIPPTVVTADTINRRDGSFATNYVKFGLNYSHNWMEGGALMQAVRETRVKVELEHHPESWMDPNIVGLYGRERLNLLGAYAARGVGWCQKRLEGSVSATWNPTVADGVDKGAIAFQGSCYPTKNGGWGFFVRYYVGQDYYNVGFLDNLARLHLGMTFNQADFFRFRSTSP